MSIRQEQALIFLDIDGVLDVFQPDVEIQYFLPEAIQYLKGLVTSASARIVVISSHRFGGKNWDILNEIFRENDMTDIDVTPSGEKYGSRTEEIQAYLQCYPDVKRYVILDDCYQDDYSGDRQIQAHLVFVDALKGLQEKDIAEACRILGIY